MKRLISLFVLLVGIAAYGQDYEEASVRLFEKGRTMLFVMEDEDHYLGMYFFPKRDNDEAFVEVEITDYKKSSKPTRMVFRPEVSGSIIKLYTPVNGVYFWHALFRNDNVFVYDSDGNFLFKIPRHS